MTMWFKQLGLFLLMALSAAPGFAEPGGQLRDDLRGALFRAQSAALERDGRQQESQIQIQREPRPSTEFGLPETSGYSGQANNSSNAYDYPRRQGRMTLEERRALRRQIDEAGHDLYAPRR